MRCIPFTKAAKPVWAKQLDELPRLVAYITILKFNYQTDLAAFHQFQRPT